VTTFHPPKSGGLAPMSLLYNGSTARFEQVKPLIGPKPSAGGTLAAIMSPLHFGNFAGILSKAIWFGLGFAMCYVTYTGLRLWLVRREEGARSLGWLDRLLVIIGLGLPLALLASTVSFLVAMPLGSATYWTPAGFLIASAAVIVAGFLWPASAGYARVLQMATAAVMLVLAPLRLLTGGPGWATAMAAGQPIIVALDLAFLLTGGWLMWWVFSARQSRHGDGRRVLQAAE
jgi:hypothetical protein